jgi:hypothetical protein
VNTASGAWPPPHEPALVDAPEVVPLMRPPPLMTGMAAASHWLLQPGTQIDPAATKPVSQVKPQAVPSQVALPFVGTGQGEHEVAPQLSVLPLLAQPSPQGW